MLAVRWSTHLRRLLSIGNGEALGGEMRMSSRTLRFPGPLKVRRLYDLVKSALKQVNLV